MIIKKLEKDREEELIKGSADSILLKPTIEKILDIVRRKRLSISDLSKEIGMAYNNTFANVKKLESEGFIFLEKTGEQNNPSIIVPLVSDRIKLKGSEQELKGIIKENKDRILRVFVYGEITKSFSLGEMSRLFSGVANLLSEETGVTIELKIREKIGKEQIWIFLIYQPPSTKSTQE